MGEIYLFFEPKNKMWLLMNFRQVRQLRIVGKKEKKKLCAIWRNRSRNMKNYMHVYKGAQIFFFLTPPFLVSLGLTVKEWVGWDKSRNNRQGFIPSKEFQPFLHVISIIWMTAIRISEWLSLLPQSRWIPLHVFWKMFLARSVW